MSSTANAVSGTQSRKRIVSIQVCRGLAALLVVFAHLHNVERKYFPTNFMGLFQFGDLGVDLFFVISGVVISTVTVGKFGDRKQAFKFLYHRFARIYPIYWFYTALVLVVYLYNPLWINASGGHHVDVVQSFLLIPTEVPMLLLQGWTLTYEVYFYLIFFVLLLFSSERLAPWLLIGWTALLLVLDRAIHPANPVAGVILSPAILEFLAGCLIFHLYHRVRLHPRTGEVLLTASLLWAAGIVLWTRHAHGSNAEWIEDATMTRVAVYGVFAVLFLSGLMELERTRLISFAAPLVAIGDWSYSIYLSHTIVLKICSHIITRFPYFHYTILVLAAFSLVLVVQVGFLSFEWIERPLMRFFYERGRSRRPVLKATECEKPQLQTP